MCECCGRKLLTVVAVLLDGNMEAELCRPCMKALQGEVKVEKISA